MDRFVVVAEFKDQTPTAMEAELHKASLDEMYELMEQMKKRPDVIRVALAKLVYEGGNRSLLPKELS